MLPITPISSFIRKLMPCRRKTSVDISLGHADFVQHEWDAKLQAITQAPQMEAGWRGILYANIGLVEGASKCIISTATFVY